MQIGPFSILNPVILAPMAGVTDPVFRAICRDQGAGLTVSEMIS
ncbi:MAG TPA: tRNA dihydrouridine synthase DusB, partial [Gammaproteobacteria bacterium]|nr:tRNA dihydrouridine synthase DusB [Gammaproteobacteria bacterium]